MKNEIIGKLDLVGTELAATCRNWKLPSEHPLRKVSEEAAAWKVALEEGACIEPSDAQRIMSLVERIKGAASDDERPELSNDVKLVTGMLSTFVLSQTPIMGADGYRFTRT